MFIWFETTEEKNKLRALARGRLERSGRLKLSDFAHSLDQSEVDFADNFVRSYHTL